VVLNPKTILNSDERKSAILDAVKRAARQEQFLDVVSAAEARRRFESSIDRTPLGAENRAARGGAVTRTRR